MSTRFAAAAIWAAAAFSPAPAGAAPRVYTVTIQNMTFSPAPAGLRIGDSVEWVNNDILRHTATAADRSFSVELAPKARARTRLAKPGVVRFFCRFHPGMKGQLSVGK